jgi:hypothetical protein
VLWEASQPSAASGRCPTVWATQGHGDFLSST